MDKKSQIIVLIILFVFAGVGITSIFQKKPDPVYLTAEQLKDYNGREGAKTYVAVNGKIYDISKCRYWRKGIHVKSPADAIGGRDLTAVLKKSKHGIERVSRYPHVGYLVSVQPAAPKEKLK